MDDEHKLALSRWCGLRVASGRIRFGDSWLHGRWLLLRLSDARRASTFGRADNVGHTMTRGTCVAPQVNQHGAMDVVPPSCCLHLLASLDAVTAVPTLAMAVGATDLPIACFRTDVASYRHRVNTQESHGREFGGVQRCTALRSFPLGGRRGWLKGAAQPHTPGDITQGQQERRTPDDRPADRTRPQPMHCRGWLTRRCCFCFVWCLHGGVHFPCAGGRLATTSSAQTENQKALVLHDEKSGLHTANCKRASLAGP